MKYTRLKYDIMPRWECMVSMRKQSSRMSQGGTREDLGTPVVILCPHMICEFGIPIKESRRV